jgi:hypothetical protein
MGKLRNWKHERFCRAIVFDETPPRDAYTLAGFEPNRANHNRLLRTPDIKARIEELKLDREKMARAARVPIAEVLAELGQHGIDRVCDFFQANAAGELSVRNLGGIRVEAALALLHALHDGAGITWDEQRESRN